MKSLIALLAVLLSVSSGNALTIENGSFENGGGYYLNETAIGRQLLALDGQHVANATETVISNAISWNAGDTIAFEWLHWADSWFPLSNNIAANYSITLDNPQPPDLGPANYVTSKILSGLWDFGFVGQDSQNTPIMSYYGITGWHTETYTFASNGSGFINFEYWTTGNPSSVVFPADMRYYVDNIRAINPIPEPSTMVILSLGIVILAVIRLRSGRM